MTSAYAFTSKLQQEMVLRIAQNLESDVSLLMKMIQIKNKLNYVNSKLALQ